jgi:hypothetical protein
MFDAAKRAWTERKTLLVALGVLLVAGAVLAATLVNTFRAGPQPRLLYTCESCGHRWEQAASAQPRCPRCSAAPSTRTWYRCPTCGKVFCGLESQKLDVGQYRYRLPGTTQWLDRPPAQLTCPGCRFTSPDMYRHRLPLDYRPGPGQG